MVSRMVDQKGLDLIFAAVAAGTLQALDASFVILGTGAPKYEKMWRDLAVRHPNRVAVTVGFNEELAHLIEGGSDIFFMPSRFEPCGLNQMYSLRYGTVPVVRATGGLDDTVTDVDEVTGEGTGFKFRAYTAEAMMEALHRALSWYARPGLLAPHPAGRHGAGQLVGGFRPGIHRGVREGPGTGRQGMTLRVETGSPEDESLEGGRGVDGPVFCEAVPVSSPVLVAADEAAARR